MTWRCCNIRSARLDCVVAFAKDRDAGTIGYYFGHRGATTQIAIANGARYTLVSWNFSGWSRKDEIDAVKLGR